MDRRNENSKKAICDAYLRFLHSNQQGKIKIADLCAAADVSKTTFYNNYKNMADMLQDVEWRFVKTVVNSIPRQSYTFETPQLFTAELTLAFSKYRNDISLLFGSDGLVRMLYLLEKEVKAEIFGLYPKYKYDARMNIILTYCIMGAANANILNMQVPFDELMETLTEITAAIRPLMNKKQEEAAADDISTDIDSDSDDENVIEDNGDTITETEEDI